MFTGIIEEMGTILDIKQTSENYELQIGAKKILEDVRRGDSIAVNGICLTVTDYSGEQFTCDVMPETLKATSLQQLHIGHPVNLERALAAGGRLGGHFVSGHVDGTGKIKKTVPEANAVYYWIELDQKFMPYVLPKGSITIEGISLTVVDVAATQFSVSLIPHTLQNTNLSQLGQGDTVNIECDMLAKYVDRLLEHKYGKTDHRQGQVTFETLAENGYI